MALSAFPFGYVTTTGGVLRAPVFWAAAALVAALLIALVRGARWAWWVFVALDVVVLASFIWSWAGFLNLALTVVRLALLLAPPVRNHVGIGSLVPRTSGSRSRVV